MTTTTFAGEAGRVILDDGAARVDIIVFFALWFLLVVLFTTWKRFR